MFSYTNKRRGSSEMTFSQTLQLHLYYEKRKTLHLENAMRDFDQEIAYRRAAWLSDTSLPAGRERNV